MTTAKTLAPWTALALTHLLLSLPLGAQEPEPTQDSAQEPDQQIDPNEAWRQAMAQLPFQDGTVTVQGGKATIAVPDGWFYLQQDGARFVVEQLWGNPPDPGTLGLLAPSAFRDTFDSWAIIVSYDDEGHYDDGDAASIDYDELLSGLQDNTSSSNEARAAEGYATVELVGWAERPSYDASSKKLYWAKHLRFAEPTGESSETLNYDVRILGRRGTLVLQAVAGMPQLGEVRDGVRTLLPAVEFVDGERYDDYQEGVDPLVVGGIGALIGGKLLLKGGFLKVLLGLWKPIALGLAAVGAFLVKLLGGRSKSEPRGRRTAAATADDATE